MLTLLFLVVVVIVVVVVLLRLVWRQRVDESKYTYGTRQGHTSIMAGTRPSKFAAPQYAGHDLN